MTPFWRQKQQDLEQEIESHLEMAKQDRIDRGQSPEQAEGSARREFGNVALVEHVTRDQWGWNWAEHLLQDLRFGARMLRKSPGYTIIAALTLALGIGANTAIFSLVSGILLQPLAYPHPEQLVSVKATAPDDATYPQGGLAAMREQIRTMDVAAYAEGHEFNLTGLGEAVRLSGTAVSAEFFSVLGAQPELGRTFRAGEDIHGQSAFVILSHSLWRGKFASDPNILGRVINLAGVPRQIVGVMRADFRFSSPRSELWIPLDIDSSNTTTYWSGDYMPVIGRLRPGATIQQAGAEIAVFQSRVLKLFPWPMPSTWNAGLSVVPLQTGLVSEVRARLLILLAAVAVVLLIACANVANLTLARAVVREKEIAIRTSLGAARHRIVRQLLTESVLMAAVGGALGLALAAAGLSLLKSTLPADTPRLADVALDSRVFLFTAILVILTGVASGLAPALRTSRTQLTGSLKTADRGTTLSIGRLRNLLVVGELALAVLLVSSAGLLIRSLWALSHVDPGFRPENLLTARVTPNESFCSEPGRCFIFYRDLVSQTRALPGVVNAAIITTLPLDGRVHKRTITIEGRTPNTAEPEPLLWMNTVSPGYFSVMNIPVLRGRGFIEADTSPGANAVILSAETAHRYWPNQDAVGKHIRFAEETDWRTIVGVVADVRGYNLRSNVPDFMQGAFYVPYGPGVTLEDRSVPAAMTLVIRSAGAQALDDPLRRMVASLNAEAPVTEVLPMPTILSSATSAPRSVTSLFASFAALALVLGVVGIYGVISFFVGQRTREFGIRIAIGAQRRDVLKLVMHEGLSLTLVGIAVGLAAAFGLTRFLAGQLYGVSPTDPADFAVVAILFSAVTLAACYMPARRAMQVDPIQALRGE